MNLNIDTDYAVFLIGIALVIFSILNIVENYKTSPSVQNQKSYSIILLVLSAVVMAMLLYTQYPPTEVLEIRASKGVVEAIPAVVIEKPKVSWNEALQQYWQTSGQQIYPKKGTVEQAEVLKIMG